MKLTILGGGGAWPTPRQACGGYLLEHNGFRLLIDPGHAVLPRLMARRAVTDIDAVLVSHAHLDHCADLPALLRARVLGPVRCEPLPVYSPRNALRRLMETERIGATRSGVDLQVFADGQRVELGPFSVDVVMLPHHVLNAGLRISAAGHVLAYTGDSGDCADRTALARDADVLLAEATYVAEVPAPEAGYLSSARQVARLALEAEAGSTILTHQWPGQPAEHALAAARLEGLATARVAFSGMTVELPALRESGWPGVERRREPIRLAEPVQLRPLRARRVQGGAPSGREISVLPGRAASS